MTTTPGAGEEPVPGAPGWFPDPWGTEKLRWWDGRAWTPHFWPPAEPAAQPTQAGNGDATARGYGLEAAASVPPPLAAERAGSHWARLAMLWAGPMQALNAIALAVQSGWYADHFDELSKGKTPKLTGAAASVAPITTYCSLGVLVASVIFLVWMYRAATVARLLGLPARRTPGVAVVSFLIPVLNFWWPYQSTLDMLPPNHPGRHVVGRWWAAWIAGSLAVPLVYVTGYGPPWVRAVAGVLAALLFLAAAAEARIVIATIEDAHSTIVEGATR
jgi:hypothetical protein